MYGTEIDSALLILLQVVVILPGTFILLTAPCFHLSFAIYYSTLMSGKTKSSILFLIVLPHICSFAICSSLFLSLFICQLNIMLHTYDKVDSDSQNPIPQ